MAVDQRDCGAVDLPLCRTSISFKERPWVWKPYTSVDGTYKVLPHCCSPEGQLFATPGGIFTGGTGPQAEWGWAPTSCPSTGRLAWCPSARPALRWPLSGRGRQWEDPYGKASWWLSPPRRETNFFVTITPPTSVRHTSTISHIRLTSGISISVPYKSSPPWQPSGGTCCVPIGEVRRPPLTSAAKGFTKLVGPGDKWP